MVQYEVVVQGATGAEEVDKASWINVQTVTNKLAVELLRERLDAGESEAIVLAMESKTNLLLMDDARGRRISKVRGIKLIGTLGVLVVAKEYGLVTEVQPLLDQLINVGFYMSSDLYQTILKQAREK